MKTEQLYYQDPYLREFSARVSARRVISGKPAVALDRTAFYPTGGGQPSDLGALGSPSGSTTRVVDVVADEDAVWHVLEGDQVAGEIRGTIDWDRRFDHMQQHTGQHVLSQAFIQECAAETVAFHLGEKSSTIDLDRIDLDASALSRAEAAANAVIDAALPVMAAYVSPDELARLPLRRPPKVTDNIRIVQIEGFDWSPCGGTHLANTSQIGQVKVVGTERRGAELRVTFLCGRRARADYARLKALAQGLAARFTAAEDDIPGIVDRRAAEADALRKDLAELEAQWVASTAAALTAGAIQRGEVRLVIAALDAPADRAKKLAQALRGRPNLVVAIGVRGERPQIIVTRSDGLDVDAGELLRIAASAGGGRGGGRPDWAQGGVRSNEGLVAALDAAEKAFRG